MKIKANTSLCSGHARCAGVAPELFTLDDNGYINFEEKKITQEQFALAQRGVRACPERALTLSEDE